MESAILDAAWDELMEVGYNHVTMEGVAAVIPRDEAAIRELSRQAHELRNELKKIDETA